jgi:tetratricopeptide (TPR) repeat protein
MEPRTPTRSLPPGNCPNPARLSSSAWLLALAVTMLLSSPRVALAADPAAPPQENREQLARRHFAEGDAAFKAGRYEAAMTEFEAGYAASPRPGFLLNMAHTARKLGDLRRARSLYKKYLLMDPTSKLRSDVLGVIGELDSALADEDRAESNRKLAADKERPREPAAPETLAEQPPLPPPPRAPPPAAEAPSLVGERARAPTSDDTDTTSPFYRSTWFWVTVGVVAAAGAGVAIYATQRSGGDPYHPSGSLGALGP